MFDDLPNYRRVMEDMRVYSETDEGHVNQVEVQFERAASKNIALDIVKMIFTNVAIVFDS